MISAQPAKLLRLTQPVPHVHGVETFMLLPNGDRTPRGGTRVVRRVAIVPPVVWREGIGNESHPGHNVLINARPADVLLYERLRRDLIRAEVAD